MIKSINTHDEFVDAMNILEMYSRKVTLLGGFDKFTAEEENEYDTLAHLVAAYEDTIPVFPPEPNQSFEKTMLINMMDFKWKVAETAEKLGISESELSEILAGKCIIDNTLRNKIIYTLDMHFPERLQAA
jgi:hypothetical protein